MTKVLAALLALFAVLAIGLGAPSHAAPPTFRVLDYPPDVAPPGRNPSYAERDVGALSATVSHGGVERRYRLYGAVAGSAPAPVVILLHGAQRTGLSMIDMWRAAADRHGLVLLAPDAAGPGWDPGADGPDLLVAMLNDAARRASLDPARVYLFGHSSGAALALLYANRVRGPWRAVAAHAGALPPAAIAPRADAPPLALFVGAEDHLFPQRVVKASAEALADAGHAVTLTVVRGHTHWYYEIGPTISEWAWRFFDEAAGR